MKTVLKCVALFSCICLLLSGCGSVGDKSTSISVIYGVVAALSFVLLVGYFTLIRKKTAWFILLFVMITVVNCGYFGLSVSVNLDQALWFNRVAYLGSVFLPVAMFMTIVNICGFRYRKWFPVAVIALSLGIFLITASPGILDIYYKSVEFGRVNGASVLIKEYGPWHSVYLFYLVGYFMAMLASIIAAVVKKKLATPAHAGIILAVVFINFGVWLLEQLADINFELLSIAYILSEMFLIALYMILQDIRLLVPQDEVAPAPASADNSCVGTDPDISAEKCRYFKEQLVKLTPTEHTVYNYYVGGKGTKEIMLLMDIKENTLKYHNKNIYGKLGVSSRKQLLAIAAALNEKES